MGTRALGSGALGRLTCALARPPAAAAVARRRRVEDGRLGRHLGALLGQQRAGQRARLGHRVLGRGVDGPVQVRLGGRGLHRLDVEDVAQVVVVDDLHELAEHGVALLLPGVEGVGLDGPAQVDAVLEVVHLGQVVTPARRP